MTNELVDLWHVTISTASFPTSPPFEQFSWQEPESSVFSNTILLQNGFPIIVFSDTNPSGGLANGKTVFNVGTDTVNGLPIDLTFTDNAANSEGHGVPDTGSAFGLLLVSLIALLGATHLRCLRLA